MQFPFLQVQIRHKRQSIELGHISIELRLSLRHAAVSHIKSKWETLSLTRRTINS